MSEEITFTSEEEAEFTFFNMTAFDMMRKEHQKKGSVSPCWLCCSEEVKEKARYDLLWKLRGMTGQITLFYDEAVKLLDIHADKLTSSLELWKRAELEFKKMRAEGNPRAFFVR